MIVLDTNVVSEAMKPEPEPAVGDWLDEQVAA
jgi:predicted nucleic acid-binding protein